MTERDVFEHDERGLGGIRMERVNLKGEVRVRSERLVKIRMEMKKVNERLGRIGRIGRMGGLGRIGRRG